MMRSLMDEMGRADPDLTPAHDEAMLWLEKHLHDNIAAMIDANWPEMPATADYLCRVNGGAHDHKTKPFTPAEIDAALTQFPLIPRGRAYRPVWEQPLSTGPVQRDGHRYGTLFLDMTAKFSQQRPTLINADYGGKPGGTWEMRRRYWHWGFEVKPRLWSIGQTLRQLKTYQRNCTLDELFLVAPHSDHAERILKQEGFGFIALPAILPAASSY